jgi:hypothetical protein
VFMEIGIICVHEHEESRQNFYGFSLTNIWRSPCVKAVFIGSSNIPSKAYHPSSLKPHFLFIKFVICESFF